jgi:hypothetical protein
MEMRYGLGLPIAGEWDTKDKLNNGGERIKLSFGAGVPIRDFSYDDKTPWPTEPDGDWFFSRDQIRERFNRSQRGSELEV